MRGRNLVAGILLRLKRLPAGLRRFKYWLLAGIFLLFLLAVAPWVPLLGKMLGAIWGLVRPLLDNPVGRFLVFNALLVLVALFLYRRFKERGRRLVGAWALDRFLAGMLELASGRYRKAARSFEGVFRVARLVDLRTAVEVYPEILDDSRIKAALCYRELGELPKAMKNLELLKVRDLSGPMRRELAEAKAFVYSLSTDLMEETIEREIANALELDPENRRLLRLRRDRAERLGDLPVAVEAQRRLVKISPAPSKGAERARLGLLHARLGLRHFREGRLEEARAEISRSRASDPSLVLPNLLSGDMEVERGDFRSAVREWSRTPSVPGLERVRGLLAEGRLAGEDDLGHLAESFPRAGILLVLAEHYLSAGDLRKARNCARKFEEVGLPNRHSAHLLAEICRREGDAEAAERLDWRALKGFLGADATHRPGKEWIRGGASGNL